MMKNSSSVFLWGVMPVILLLIVAATAFGTIKVMDYCESALLDNEIKAKIGVENFAELGRIETTSITTTKYYSKSGDWIIEDEEVSEGTTIYNE